MLGIGLGLQKGGLILSDAQIYAKAAEAAGGTVESISCVKASFDALKSISLANVFSDAAIAFSLEDLELGNITKPINVRRSTDNVEQEFTYAEITDGSLTTFCGAGDGFVVNWYDQSNNAFHVSNITAVEQPKIVSAGALILENGKPAMFFDGGQSLENTTIFIDSTAYSSFIVNSFTDVSGSNNTVVRARPLGAYGAEEGYSFYEISNSGVYTNAFIDDGEGNAIGLANGSDSFLIDTQYLMSNIANISSFEAWKNSAVSGTFSLEAGSTPLNSVAISQLYLGQTGAGSRYFNGYLQELIIYDSNQSDNLTEIENNINSRYAIY